MLSMEFHIVHGMNKLPLALFLDNPLRRAQLVVADYTVERAR